MRRYKDSEKAEILKEVESVGNVSLVSKKRGISHTMIHVWIKKGLKGDKRNYPAENRNLRKRISDLELKNEILKELLKKSPSFIERESIARFYISKGHCKSLVLTECGVCSSGYYKKFSKRNEKDTGKQEESGVLAKKRGMRGKRGRPYPGYSEDIVGQKTSDEVLIKLLKTYRKQLEFGNWGGCKVLSRYLLRDYGLRVNKKKVYRLCKQEFLLLPKPKKKLRNTTRIYPLFLS